MEAGAVLSFVGLDQEMGGQASWYAAATLDIILPLSAIKVRLECHRFINISTAASKTTLVMFPLYVSLHIESRGGGLLTRQS